MKHILLTLLLLIPATAFAQVDAETSQKRNTFSDTKYLFSLTYSDKWQVLESEEEATRLVFVSTSESGDLEAFFTVTSTYDDKLKIVSSKEFAELIFADQDEIKRVARETSESANSIESNISKVGGYTAIAVQYKFTDVDDGKMRKVVRFDNTVLVDGYIYDLAFVINESAVEKWTAEIDAIVASFNIRKPEN